MESLGEVMTVSMQPVLFLGFQVMEGGRNLFLVREAASSFSDKRSLTSSRHCLMICSYI